MTAPTATRACPHCGAANPLDLNDKCAKCRKKLPLYCFACYAAIKDESVRACPACGRRRWVIGDHAQIACVYERGAIRRQRYLMTSKKDGRIVHEWRCMKCLADETVTDAFDHFPDDVTA